MTDTESQGATKKERDRDSEIVRDRERYTEKDGEIVTKRQNERDREIEIHRDKNREGKR